MGKFSDMLLECLFCGEQFAWRSVSVLRVLCELCGLMHLYSFVPRWHMTYPSGFLALYRVIE